MSLFLFSLDGFEWVDTNADGALLRPVRFSFLVVFSYSSSSLTLINYIRLHIRVRTLLLLLLFFAVVFDFLRVAAFTAVVESVVVAVFVAFPVAAFVVIVVFAVDFVFVLVATVPSVFAALFVAFPSDTVVDAVSPALAAPGIVVEHPDGEEDLTSSVLTPPPLSKHSDHRGLCQTLPLHPPLMLLGEIVAPCFHRDKLSTSAPKYHMISSRADGLPPPQASTTTAHQNCGCFCNALLRHCYLENKVPGSNAHFIYN